ncbi:hypothetical protein LHL20_00010 [Alteromonas sp. McT4-15]|uniref:hypothetical protein n=1 Tax=Alteromonas sp. McT4-15 TaxID=2881256 RepID=UPI001CF8E023|nr:hypothetical protein [Alteromonas sp. McT4-15]MCB4434618.1 hypothetical protein [Alteromonas sp. McT4-15]
MKHLSINTGDQGIKKITELVLGSKLVGFEIPKSQSLTCTWSLRLFFELKDNSIVLCCSSDVESSDSKSWQEYGYLKLEIIEEKLLSNRDKFNFCKLKPISFSKVFMLVNEEDDVVAECGLLLTNDQDEQVLISTSPAPGAISVKAEFYDGEYEPEVFIDDLRVLPL